MVTPEYEATGVKAHLEPGLRGRVLCNRLAITRVCDVNGPESYGQSHRAVCELSCR